MAGRPERELKHTALQGYAKRQVPSARRIVPMSPDLREEMMRYVPRTDEPEIRARQRHMAKIVLDMNPDLRREVVEEAVEKTLSHQFERRLGRRLIDEEHRMLSERLAKLGADRVGDVLVDLPSDALAAWLADPNAS